MKNNKLLILVGLVVLGLGVFIIYDSQTKEEPSFKPVELKQENSVINGSLPSYYDTIVNVGLELVGIEGVTVTIEELPEEV